ncbi:hypothetical protein COV94_04780, partial [Candidatus Woesearchaeota archaeon CG11_big_fil_rev_8_21_14_0_20_57_5]
ASSSAAGKTLPDGCSFAHPYHLCMETLSNDLRLQIVELLRDGPLSVSGIARAVSAERTKVSHALAKLRACSIVTTERAGKRILYSLNERSWVAAPAHALFARGGGKSATIAGASSGLFYVLDEHIHSNCPVCSRLQEAAAGKRQVDLPSSSTKSSRRRSP